MKLHDPDQLLQGRGLERLLLGPLRVDLRELSEARLHVPRQRHPGLRDRSVQRRLRRGGHDPGLRTGIRAPYYNNYYLLLRQGSPEAGQRPGLQVLQHRLAQPRGEVQLQLPAADRRLGVGLARRPELGQRVRYSSLEHALLSRGVRPVYKNGVPERNARRHDHDGQPHGAGRASATTCSRPRTFRARPSATRCSRTCFRPIQYHGASAPGSSTSRTGSRAFRRRTPSARRRRRSCAASYAQFADQLGFIGYYGSGVPISNGYYYYWTDNNHDHIVQPSEVELRAGVYGFYNGIDPATLPNIPNVIQPNLKTPKTNEFTVGVDQQFTDTFAVSATFTYRNTNNLIQNLPNGVGASAPGSSRGERSAYRRRREPRAALHGHRAQRLHALVRRALLLPDPGRTSRPASRSPTDPARRRSTTASTSRSSSDCRTTGCCAATSAGTASSST